MTHEITGAVSADALNESAPERGPRGLEPFDHPNVPMATWDPRAASNDEMSQEGLPYAFSRPSSAYAAGGARQEIVGTVFEDIGGAVSDAANAVAGAVSDAVDAIGHIPGISFIVEQVNDFSKTALGHVFMAALGPMMLTELLTTMPGVGLQVSQTLASLGPVANQMLPGLAKGDPVDKVFVQSVKDVVSRASAAGGASVANKYLTDGLQLVTGKLKELGVDPASLHNAPFGVELVPQQAREAAAQRLAPLLKSLAEKAAIPQDILQAALDGITRTTGYDKRNFDPKTGALLTPQQLTDQTIDGWLLEKVGTVSVMSPLGVALPSGGRFHTVPEVMAMAKTRAKDFGGTMGASAGHDHVYGRVHALAKTGQRPDEKDPVTAAADVAAASQKALLAKPPANTPAALRARGNLLMAMAGTQHEPQATQTRTQAGGYLAQAAAIDAKTKAADTAEIAQKGMLASPPADTPAALRERANLLMAMAGTQHEPQATQSRLQASTFLARAAALEGGTPDHLLPSTEGFGGKPRVPELTRAQWVMHYAADFAA